MDSATARRICVTGASGKAGRAVVQELVEHGYEISATDIATTSDDLEAGVVRADLTDYGQALETLKGANAVIHLANIPAPGLGTPAVTFNANVTMNFNVFLAAARLGLRRVVWASSETTLGLFFGIGPQQWPSLEAEGVPPRYAPVDEDHYPLPTSTYALSKVASETVAEHVAQWSGIPFVALRFSNIMVQDDYEEFPSFWPDPQHASGTCGGTWTNGTLPPPAGWRSRPRRARRSSPSFIIAAADTVMNRAASTTLAEVFPGVPLTREVAEFDTCSRSTSPAGDRL